MLLVAVLPLLSPLFSAPAHAACDAKAIVAEMAEASSLSAATLFVDLAACDAALAKKLAPKELPHMIGGEEGNAAMLAAIDLGATDAAVAWIDALQSDDRAKAMGALGEACPSSETVQDFFVSRAQKLGADFWTQRWYGALATCPAQKVQALLATEVDKGLGTDRARFFSVLDTYARGSGAQAIPRLKGLLAGTGDDEAQSRIVASFAEAARVGSLEGTDTAAATAATAAITELSPGLTVKGIEQARITLKSLGAEQAADELAGIRYAKLKKGDGSMLWGAVVLEDATCKNGKRMQRAHVAEVIEPGRTWSDEMEGKVRSSAEVAFTLDLAAKCKGTGTLSVKVSPEPLADTAAFKAWAGTTLDAMKAPDAAKFIRMDQDKLKL